MERPRPEPRARGGPDEDLRARLRRADGLLFLCSGNIMRSAFCELYARHRGCPLPVASAATVYRNSELHPATVRALEARGAAPELWTGFEPRRVERVLPGPTPAALVLGMDAGHLAVLPPQVRRARTALVSELVGSRDPVPDPIGHADPGPVFDHLARCVDALLEALEAS